MASKHHRLQPVAYETKLMVRHHSRNKLVTAPPYLGRNDVNDQGLISRWLGIRADSGAWGSHLSAASRWETSR